MDKYLDRTHDGCFYELRRKGSLPLMSMEQSIELNKRNYVKNSTYGMDIYSDTFKAEELVLLHKKKNFNNSIPICCSFYILVLNIKGDSVQHVNQYSYDVKPHSLQLLVPGLIYSFEDKHIDNESLVIFFEHQFLSSLNLDLLEFFVRSYEANSLDDETYTEVMDLFKKINLEYRNKKVDYQDFAKTILLQLLHILKREKSSSVTTSITTRSEQISKQFLALIEENFQTKKTVKEYATILGITAKHLSETIKENLNESALYLIHTRIIKEIQYQLCYTTLSIKEIASSLFFTNSSDFGRFFKRYQKMSPKSYRLTFQV